VSQEISSVAANDSKLFIVDLDTREKEVKFAKAFLWKDFVPLSLEVIRYR
jgi:hypothetical protein